MQIEQRMENLERRCNRWQMLCVVQLVALCAIAAAWLSKPALHASASDGVLHARGLVIEDANGRARILMGAPFPAVKDRLRQDQRTPALLFLDDKGHDRLTVGEAMAAQIAGKVDPNWKRIGSAEGVFLHNTEGDERGGYSWLSIGRGAMTLDRPTAEALGAFVDDKTGRAGMVFDYPGEVSEGASAVEIITKGKRGSISLHDAKDAPRATWAIDDGTISGSPH